MTEEEKKFYDSFAGWEKISCKICKKQITIKCKGDKRLQKPSNLGMIELSPFEGLCFACIRNLYDKVRNFDEGKRCENQTK